MGSSLESPVPRRELLSARFDARSDSGAVWGRAWLRAASEEVLLRETKASGDGGDFSHMLSGVEEKWNEN
jgi:hypothetical protein